MPHRLNAPRWPSAARWPSNRQPGIHARRVGDVRTPNEHEHERACQPAAVARYDSFLPAQEVI